MIDSLHHLARHYVHASYHLLSRCGIPSAYVPDAFLVLTALGLTIWLVLFGLVGRQAARKGQSFWYGFLFAALTTPFVASLFIAFLKPLKPIRKSTRKRLAFGAGGRDRERVA